MMCLLCKREDLPPAVGFPSSAKMTVAHAFVDAKGTGQPCMIGSPTGAYDVEVHQLVCDDDKLWDPTLRREPEPIPGGVAVDGKAGPAQPDAPAVAPPSPEGSSPSPTPKKIRKKR